MISLAILGLAYVAASANMSADIKAHESIKRRFDFINFEDEVRDSLANYTTAAIGQGVIPCNAIQQELRVYFDANDESRAEAQSGYRLDYYVNPTGNANTRCTAAVQTKFAATNQIYFCLKAISETEAILNPTSPLIEAGVVEVLLAPINMLDEAPMTCAAFQAATKNQVLTTNYPGTRIYYNMHWKALDPSGGAKELQRTGVLYSTPISGEP